MNPDETPAVDTEETPVDGVETPEVKEDGDEEETAPEAGAMPAEDGDKSDAAI
ncbi:MAG: hypothetical protein AAB669_02960 [Patescibacteria group bacterium]